MAAAPPGSWPDTLEEAGTISSHDGKCPSFSGPGFSGKDEEETRLRYSLKSKDKKRNHVMMLPSEILER